MNRAKAFYEAVLPFFHEEIRVLTEFCAGDGKGGVEFDKLGLEKIIFVDVREVNKFKKNTLQLKTPFESYFSGIDEVNLEENDFIIAIHSCGELTDKIIEKVVNTRTLIAVMPCCYNPNMKKYSLENPPDKRKLLYNSEKDYYDAFRIQYLKEQGFETQLLNINKRITPMNNIIIGIPKE